MPLARHNIDRRFSRRFRAYPRLPAFLPAVMPDPVSRTLRITRNAGLVELVRAPASEGGRRHHEHPIRARTRPARSEPERDHLRAASADQSHLPAAGLAGRNVRCARCTVHRRLREVLGDNTGGIRPELRALHEALAATDRPATVVGWLNRSAAPLRRSCSRLPG